VKREAPLNISTFTLKAIVITVLLVMFSSTLVLGQGEEDFIQQRRINKTEAVMLSLVYPGLGQMTAGQNVKGVSFFFFETAALVLFVNEHESYQTKQAVYDRDLNDFRRITLEGGKSYVEAKDAYNDLKDLNSQLDKHHTTRNIAAFTALGVYALNIVDVLVFSPSSQQQSETEQNAYLRFRKEYQLTSTMIDQRTPGILVTKRF
jgi:hypothetical protein